MKGENFARGSTAEDWFADAAEWRQLCLDARGEARGEKAEQFTHEMLASAVEHGLRCRCSQRQMEWLCKIADWAVPTMREHGG